MAVQARVEVDGAGGAPQRAPMPREHGGGRTLPGWREVEDAPEKVIGEVGQAKASGGHWRCATMATGRRRHGGEMQLPREARTDHEHYSRMACEM